MSPPPWIDILPEGGLLFFMVLFAAVLAYVFLTGTRATWAQHANIPLDDGIPSAPPQNEVTHG